VSTTELAPSPAVAPPGGNPRFRLLDALRGIAVLAVVVFHVTLVSGFLARPILGDAAAVLGTVGPILFFALSGFLLYRPWVAARVGGMPAPRAAVYARRRALRILPAYWVALTVLAVFPGIAGVFSGDGWRYYGFLQLYAQDTVGRGIPVAWTLCVEVSFYLVLPLWALAFRRVRRLRVELAALALVAVAGAAVQLAAAHLAISHLLASSLLGECTWFALGMALALASVSATRGDSFAMRASNAVAQRPGLCWVCAGAAFAGLVWLHRDSGGVLGIIAALSRAQPYGRTLADLGLTAAVLALLIAPAVFGDQRGGVPRRLLAWGPLAWLGLVSYGVYLWHLTIAEFLALPASRPEFSATGLGLADSLGRAATPVLFALVLGASCAVAALSYRFVELPFLRRKDPRPVRAAAPAPTGRP
jgi:peptidoglycan/LPS O-acetylase OafA/YrhL